MEIIVGKLMKFPAAFLDSKSRVNVSINKQKADLTLMQLLLFTPFGCSSNMQFHDFIPHGIPRLDFFRRS
jgi:hypothetical protein